MTNFEKVQQLTDEHKLRIVSILAASRTISTTLSKSIASHPEAFAEVLQPFHLRHPFVSAEDAEREEKAYGLILEAYTDAVKARSAVQANEPIVVVVSKEMARNLVDPDMLRRWDSVSKKHLLTIREPLLALESTVRLYFDFIEKHPEGLEKQARAFAAEHNQTVTPEYLQKFPNIYAKSLGYKDASGLGQHWKVYAKHAMKTKDYTQLGPLLEEFFPFYDLNSRFPGVAKGYLAGASDVTAKQAGFKDLAAFAKEKGFRNWNDLQQHVATTNDFEVVAPLLKAIFATSNTGWAGLGNLLNYFNNGNKKARMNIIDGTILRADPEFVTDKICEHFALDKSASSSMINWEDVPVKPVYEDSESSYRGVFVRAHNSVKLQPPTDTPVSPARFPKQFQDHFTQVVMPIYISALADERCIRPRGKEQLQALLNKHVPDGRALEDIDPVWAYALASTDKQLHPQEKEEILSRIRESKSAKDFSDVFATIDAIAQEQLRVKYKSQRTAEMQ